MRTRTHKGWPMSPDGKIIRTRQFLRLLEKEGYHSVYVIGPRDGRVAKVGIAADPIDRHNQLQVGHWEALRIWHYWWFAGRPLTARIEAEAIVRCGPHIIRGEWFGLHPDEVGKVVGQITVDLKIPPIPEENIAELGREAFGDPNFDWKYKADPFLGIELPHTVDRNRERA